MPFLSSHILTVLQPFSVLFSHPVWENAITLLLGTILCRGGRTVCAALRIMGLKWDTSFAKYHHVLNRVKWSPLQGSRILLKMFLSLTRSGPLVMFIDETLERRRGPKIKAKGYYRDAVRSSKSTIVKASGLKWLVLSIRWKFSFSLRYFALPFMSVLQPSSRADQNANRRHKTTIEWTIQMLKQVVRWVGSGPLTLVGDGGFASGALAWACLKLGVSLVSRLKVNARLYDFVSSEDQKKRGRKRTKGNKLLNFKEMLKIPDLNWEEAVISCYGNKNKRFRYISNTSLWGVDGFQPVPIRWVLIIDPEYEFDPIPLMCTDVMMSAKRIIELYIQRWNLEVTFREVREHLGVETQRQWSDKAIARTTPILLGLYTIICLIANRIQESEEIRVEKTAWYEKTDATFSNLLKIARRKIWEDNLISRKGFFGCFRKNSTKEEAKWQDSKEPTGMDKEKYWVRVLIEHLAAA